MSESLPHRKYTIAGAEERYGEESIRLESNGYTGKASAAMTVNSYALHDNGDDEVTAGGDAAYAADFYKFANNGGRKAPGQQVGAQGFATGDQKGVGLSGCGMSTTPEVDMVGTAGVASAGPGGKATGLYGSVIGTEHIHSKIRWEETSLLLDAKTGKHLQIGRNENGKQVWAVNSKGWLMTGAPPGFQATHLSFCTSTGNSLFVGFPDGEVREIPTRR